MNKDIESFYAPLGQAVHDALPEFLDAWVTFEVIESVWGTESFFRTSDQEIRYNNERLEAIEQIFLQMRQSFINSGQEPFTQAEIHLNESGKFAIEFGYEDVSDFGLADQRRAQWIERVFGKNAAIQWS